MSPFDWTIIAGAICGVCMVVGGILLLYKGAIKLDEVKSSGAFTLEFQKFVKIQTSYPALGLFAIGLAFIIVALFFAPKTTPITLRGKIEGADPQGVVVRVKSADWMTLEPDTDGSIDTVVYPNVQRVEIQVQAAGCKPETAHFTLAANKTKGGVLDLPKMNFEKIADKPGTGKIIPANVQLPPLETTQTFN